MPPRRILLVEDNEINRIVAREMLTAAGHSVTEAINGERAIEVAGSEPFDLILMDISMPVMDGRQATREIRSGNGASAQTPIVALTANAMAEEQEAFLMDGMNDILTKPLTRDGLLQVITNYAVVPVKTATPRTEQTNAVASTYLDELKSTIGNDALDALLGRFRNEVDATLAFLQDYPSPTPGDIAARAHRIAGSAATLGAIDLRAGLIKVEEAAKSDDAEALAKAIDALPAIWAATRPQMRADQRTPPH